MKRDHTYRVILENLRHLEDLRSGSNIVTISSPDDLEDKIVTRRYSKEFKDVISRYRERRAEFEEKMDELSDRRARLVNQLFPN